MKAIIWDFSGTLATRGERKKLFPYAKDILKKCQEKFKQALVTTNFTNPRGRLQLIESLGIGEFFDIVKVGPKTKNIFIDLCKKFKCKPDDVYVIGDGYKCGIFPKEIYTGNQLGMKTIWCNFEKIPFWKERMLGIKYWKRIYKLKELEEILEI